MNSRKKQKEREKNQTNSCLRKVQLFFFFWVNEKQIVKRANKCSDEQKAEQLKMKGKSWQR
jgi:hypothetical protein